MAMALLWRSLTHFARSDEKGFGLRLEEEEPASRGARGAGVAKKKKVRKNVHTHIGPYARAYGTGRAFCPLCDAEKILRLTERERDNEKAAQHQARASRDRSRS